MSYFFANLFAISLLSISFYIICGLMKETGSTIRKVNHKPICFLIQYTIEVLWHCLLLMGVSFISITINPLHYTIT